MGGWTGYAIRQGAGLAIPLGSRLEYLSFFVLWFVCRHRGDGADLPSPAEPNAKDHHPPRSQSSVTRGSPSLPVLEGHIRVDGSICGSDRQILTPSFIPQRHHRIHFRRSPRGYVAGYQGNDAQQERDPDKRHWIRFADMEEQALHQPCQGERS